MLDESLPIEVILEAAPVALVAVDPTGTIALANRRAERLFGFEAGDLAGRPIEALVPNAARRAHARRRAVRDSVPAAHQTGMRPLAGVRRDGSEFPADVQLAEVDAGGTRLVVAAVLDLTEHVALEERTRHAQKMELVGQLAGGLAHDFNNVLGGINGYAQLLLDEVGGDSPFRSDLEEIQRAADRASRITRQLLALGRRQAGSELVDLNAVALDLEPLLRTVAGQDVEYRRLLSPEPCPVRADRGHVEQVVLNLVVNARDAMPDGGRLTVRTGLLDQPCPDPADLALAPGRYAALSVTDTGVGMDPEIRNRAFEPFFTTKTARKGSGLGLSTAYGIVRRSGGTISLETEPGRGTAFTVCLPLASSPSID